MLCAGLRIADAPAVDLVLKNKKAERGLKTVQAITRLHDDEAGLALDPALELVTTLDQQSLQS